MTVRPEKGVSRVLDEALQLLYYDGWVWRGLQGTRDEPGLCLAAAVNVANHGHPNHTDQVPENWEVSDRLRTRAANSLRVLLDVIFPDEEPHGSTPLPTARRRVEEWNDEFGRQECDVLAALRRGCRLAAQREEIGLLL